MPPTERSETRLSSAIVDAEGDLILTDPEPYLYRALPDNIEHRVVAGDTWQRLSYVYYGRADLAWVVMNFQRDATGLPAPVYDPTLALEPGASIVLPSLRTVNEEVLSESRRKEFQS